MTLHTHRDSTLVVFGDSLSDNGNLFNLIGMPSAPYWEGRSSNGPNYAEQLAKLMHMQLDDRAYAFAEASDASLALLTDPSGNPLPINLSNQIDGYIAGLHGHQAPHDTTALINIGSNDYDAFFLGLDPSTIQSYIANVVGSIEQAVDALTQVGVEKIILYTLPDFGITPNAQAEGPQVVAEVHAVDLVNNAALHQIAASHPNVELVDVFQLTEAFAADPNAFGFNAHFGAARRTGRQHPSIRAQ